MEASDLSGFSAGTASKFRKVSDPSPRHSRDGPSKRSIVDIEPMAWDLRRSDSRTTALKIRRGDGDMMEPTTKGNDTGAVCGIAVNPCRYRDRDLALAHLKVFSPTGIMPNWRRTADESL